MLDDDNPELQAALQNTDRSAVDTDTSGNDTDGDGALTDQLLADEDTTVCWTCGSEVEREVINDTFESLRSLREAKSHERNEITTELDDLTDTRSQREAERDQRERLERKLGDIDCEIADREAAVDDLETQDQDHSELLDLHKEANQLEFELGRLETDLVCVYPELISLLSRRWRSVENVCTGSRGSLGT